MAPRDVLGQHSAALAPLLLGARLTSTVGGERVVLRITEVEAYGGVGEDPGSHAFRRQTPRNATMFGPPGRAYVYFTYGMHWCLNLVTGPVGTAGAVLLRAGEVVDGVAVARARRPSARSDRDLARGPARLTTALGVTGNLDGVDLLSASSRLRLTLPRHQAIDCAVSARTGVGGAGAGTPWRFFLHGEPTVSPYRRAGR
jgi:DNA-3-methyladenine glycosylase